MYTVECDGHLIHDQKSPEKEMHLVKPTLKLQENAAGSFEFTMVPTHPEYDTVVKMISIIVVRRDGNTIWTGRPLSEHTDFYGNKQIVCEGALAFLNDTIQDPQEYVNKNVKYIFRAIIEAHNAKVEQKRQFSFGSITVQDFDDDYFYETNYNSTWTTIKEQFIDRLEGHVSIHYNGSDTTPYIDYSEDYNTTSQEINFGENLLDFSKDYDMSNLFTVIFPKGQEITQNTTGTDAGDDRNPQTSNKTSYVNGVTVSYTVITSDIRVTAKVTNITVDNTVKYQGEYNFKVVLGDNTIVSRDATYTSTTVNGEPVRNYQQAKACVEAGITEANQKITNDTAKNTYMRDKEAKSDNLVINVFGKSTTIKINIPVKDYASEYLTGKPKREYTTIASVNNGSVYLENTTAINTYGRIEREIEFNDVDIPKKLKELGQRYLQSTQFDDMSLTVSAIDLHYLNPSIQFLDFLDQVRCISSVHGMDKVFPITELDIPLDSPDQVTYTLGKNNSATMSSKTVANSSNFQNALQNIPSFTNSLEAAKNEISATLNRRTNGYVSLVQENDISQALIISDTPDWQTSTKLWKWDINGLGYSDTRVEDVNYDGPSAVADGRWYKMGITMDGTIVADVIKTGILEDGMGRNYWNLSTGEFRLQPGAVYLDNDYSVADLQEDVADISDAANLADDKATAAATAAAGAALSAGNANAGVADLGVKFNFVDGKEYGVANLLNGSYSPKILENSSSSSDTWSNGNWLPTGGGNGDRKLLDCNKDTLGVNSPNDWLVKCIQLQGCTNRKETGVAQLGVPVGYGTVYTLSCYVLGTGTIHMAAGTEYIKNNQMIAGAIGTWKPISNQTDWKRYSLVFTTMDENTTTYSSIRAGVVNGKIDVYFGNTDSYSTHKLIIAGMKLEKGNTPTDWCPSVDDINKEAQEYTREFVEENVPKETKAQIEAYDQGLKGETVLKKLTDGFKYSALYFEKISRTDPYPSLLINADYIRTGMLDASIIRTGWIRDTAGNNQWNLTTGRFETTNMKASDIRADGIFTCGNKNSLAVQLQDGVLHGYASGKYVGSIEVVGGSQDYYTRENYDGLTLRGKGIISIRSPRLAVRAANDNGVGYYGITKRYEFKVVESIRDIGNGAIEWYTTYHGFDIINGIVTAAW